MCKKRDKSKKEAQMHLNITDQTEMRHNIIAKLDKVILNWNPEFAKLNDELRMKSDLILQNLKSAREILASMFIPREDRRVLDYYDIIIDKLQILEDKKRVMQYVEDNIWEPASVKILNMAQAWEKLN
ncbi:MAG: hypothetical protein K2L70_08155 [Clostridia bacterium]|nr:hypothetical protein [Clostridia bacterium]